MSFIFPFLGYAVRGSPCDRQIRIAGTVGPVETESDLADNISRSLWGGPASSQCLLETFRARAADNPGAVAVADGDIRVTYQELEAWAALIARTLAEHGVRPGDTVAVTGPRGVRVVAALMGVLWAGAGYLPLDSEYPAPRLRHMLADASPRLLLSVDDDPDWDTAVLALRIPDQGPSEVAPPVPCSPERVGYIIYTSGSTGWPKGVAIPHSCLDNMVAWQWRHSVRPDLVTAQFAPLNFDVSFQEILGALCGGGRLVVVPEALRRDAFELLDWLEENHIERLFVPVVALQMLAVAAEAQDYQQRLALAEINAAGEQLVCAPAIRRFIDSLSGCRLNNHYGQSESAMVTVYTLGTDTSNWPALAPIGVPITGCEVLIEPVDAANPDFGELLVAGAPLSLGYLNQPDLNAQRYTDVTPTEHDNSRAFRTGDLVSVEDGVIFFHSRLDHDVKIRGYRVNLLEIEAHLLEIPGVTGAICVALERPSGTRVLYSAVVSAENAGRLDQENLTGILRGVLPEPFIPVFIRQFASFPRTPSGKVDREKVTKLLEADL